MAKGTSKKCAGQKFFFLGITGFLLLVNILLIAVWGILLSNSVSQQYVYESVNPENLSCTSTLTQTTIRLGTAARAFEMSIFIVSFLILLSMCAGLIPPCWSIVKKVMKRLDYETPRIEIVESLPAKTQKKRTVFGGFLTLILVFLVVLLASAYVFNFYVQKDVATTEYSARYIPALFEIRIQSDGASCGVPMIYCTRTMSPNIASNPICQLITGDSLGITNFNCKNIGSSGSVRSFNMSLDNARPPGNVREYLKKKTEDARNVNFMTFALPIPDDTFYKFSINSYVFHRASGEWSDILAATSIVPLLVFTNQASCKGGISNAGQDSVIVVSANAAAYCKVTADSYSLISSDRIIESSYLLDTSVGEFSPIMQTAINSVAVNPTNNNYFALSFEASGNSDTKITCYEDRTSVADVIANVLGLLGSALGARLALRTIMNSLWKCCRRSKRKNINSSSSIQLNPI